MPTTVLFVHGLESGPHGRKRRLLEQAGFEVIAGQMPCGRRALLRDPVVWALAVFGGRPAITRRAFRRSVDVQLALLASHRVDVVVGSSYGGAVALELLARGAWTGPTVLLCPAHRLVAERARQEAPALPVDASHVVVVHGRQDQTVPIEHSRGLVGGGATLVEVDDDHKLSTSATPANLATWVDESIRGGRRQAGS